MTRVSKTPLSKELKAEVYQQFWASISKLTNVQEVAAFFSDFLTDTEEYMLAKRLTVAILLLRGKSPVEIVRVLHVTYTMVGTVGSWLKNAQPATRKVLKKINNDVDWRQFVDMVEAMLDELPLAYGTNWTRVNRERRERRISRSERSQL